MSDSTPAPQVWPSLRARDARALIRFLVDVVGFEETVVHGDPDDEGIVHHAQLSWPLGGGIMLGSTRTDIEAADDPWALQPGTFGAYVVVADADGIDALHARCRAAGAPELSDVVEQDYGSRDFRLRDPEGNFWAFGTYRGEPRRSG